VKSSLKRDIEVNFQTLSHKIIDIMTEAISTARDILVVGFNIVHVFPPIGIHQMCDVNII
jgi:hypothetical protein